MIAIVDYGAGNLRSVQKALRFIGAPCEITGDARKIAKARGVILPGVGSFGDCMANMHVRGLAGPLRAAALGAVAGKRPFLGICLGLQLLFESSEETPGEPGLAVLPGRVEKLPFGPGLKVPHMGWNSVALRRDSGVFAGIPDGAYFYFVHSFCVRAGAAADVAARAEYGAAFDAAVARGLLAATQFHPEKSGETGLLLLKNFLELTK
ncbi:MAG: imidazole glycerol phosphate synthase subunit HisH [Oscillospiraceae bacterium]|jgi:glutamine amidotransferase|nr:imidazole glycerol phosphate synthase subunit HisH [Oscillospiraceae bacterium]